MNSLSEELGHPSELVLEKDMLFATLSTKAKKFQKDNNPPFILIDTVGFINKLPHELIRSFESTLSDVIEADLLIHVVDGAYFNQLQIDVTKSVLRDLGADHIERILVLTKKEIAPFTPSIDDEFIFLSNRTKENIDVLIQAIYGHIYKDNRIYILKIPFEEGQLFSSLKDNNTVLETRYEADGIYVKATLTPDQVKQYKKYIVINV